MRIAAYNSQPAGVQALSILESLGQSTLLLEDGQELPSDATLLIVCNPGARFPNRFLRMMPEDSGVRELELEKRSIVLDSRAAHVKKLVLIHPNETGANGSFASTEAKELTSALKGLVGFKSPKRKRVRRRHGHARDGLSPYLCG